VVIAQRVVREAAQLQRNVQATDAMMFSPQGGIRHGTIPFSGIFMIYGSCERLFPTSLVAGRYNVVLSHALVRSDLLILWPWLKNVLTD